MARSLITIDLAAIRANVRRLREAAGRSEVWAVVKADAYGHGVADVAPAVLEAGASALCVANVAEGLEVRRVAPAARILVMGPASDGELAPVREAGLELVVTSDRVIDGVRAHLKLDTGMGRWGLSELSAPGREVVGLMTHFASSETDPAFTALQLERFLEMTAPWASSLARHAANSAAALSLPGSHLDAVRCGIAIYGISPFGDDPSSWGLRPALRWESEVAETKLLAAGESTGYGRRFVAASPTWIALVPVGYADGFRRDMTDTEVAIEGRRCRVVGTVSMDVIAVQTTAPLERGAPVTLIGDGILIEDHARVADTIGYEIACSLNTRQPRAERRVLA